jgi:uncharacterized membrane protein YbhN (UPF0104 family)
MRRLLIISIKAAVSALLLWFAASRVDWTLAGGRLRDADMVWGSLALVLLIAQTAVLALRWREIVLQSGLSITMAQATRYSFVGALFNQTMPSTVGGDAARVWLLGRESGAWSRAAYSVIVDRAIGLLVLALIVVVCLPWTLNIIPAGTGRNSLLVISALGIFGLLGVFIFDLIVPPRLAAYRVVQHLLGIALLAKRCLLVYPANAAISFFSVLIHFVTIVAVWMIAKSLLVPIGFEQVFMLVPPILLVTAIPISIGGWGIREGATVAAFSFIGLPSTDGFLVSIMLGILLFIVGVVGGVLWILQQKRPALPAADEIGGLQ